MKGFRNNKIPKPSEIYNVLRFYMLCLFAFFLSSSRKVSFSYEKNVKNISVKKNVKFMEDFFSSYFT